MSMESAVATVGAGTKLSEAWQGSPTRLEDLPLHIRHERKDLDGREIEFKAAPASELKTEGDSRTLEGWGAVAGNVDGGLDRLKPGAFQKTIAERFPANKVKLFHEHREGIGMPEVLEDRERGLWIKGRVLEGDYYDRFWEAIKGRVTADLSIGFTPTRSSFVEEDGEVIREIEELKLFEVSVVRFPMNELARITSVKSDLAVAHNFIQTPADCIKVLDLVESVVTAEGYTKEDARLAERLTRALKSYHLANAGATTSPDAGDAGATTFAVDGALIERASQLQQELQGQRLRRRLVALTN